MDLTTFIEPTVDLPRLAQLLDGLGHEGRFHTIRTWTARQQSAIFEAAKGFRPIDLDFLFPGTTDAVQCIHDGHNSMPIFTGFQKRFARIEGEPDALAGWNWNPMGFFSGPGYFTARRGEGEHEGELVFDYTRIPKSKPDIWPELRPNGGFIPAIVYGSMIDYVRGISTHVSIGTAYKHGKPRNQWFALVRQDPR